MTKIPELLAPAGNIESFHAAAENGADAVYLGLKRFNARATAANFSLVDLSRVIPYARRRGIRVYVALNSILSEFDLPEILDTLQGLRDLAPDALIVQDAGLFFLVQKFFPGLELHASTLMTAHSSAGVNALARMGASRVVLARELDLNEIETIAANVECELEVFIHGALCFSYSGLCLTSSFQGGRSGLRGMCVQPCRLQFRQGGNKGFFLSCGDQCALPYLPKLKRMRLSALKIEGRMKPADYIGLVVRAYRTVLDAAEGEEQEAIAESRKLLAQTPSRRLTAGYLDGGGSGEILAPHRSGSSGLWIGTVCAVENDRVQIDLRHPLEKGDRLRPESEEGVEKGAFSVSRMFLADGAGAILAKAGEKVFVATAGNLKVGERLFKVGKKTEPGTAIWKRIMAQVPSAARYAGRFPDADKVWNALETGAKRPPASVESLILKVDSPGDLNEAFASFARFVLVTATRANLETLAKQRFSRENSKRIGFSLPAILPEGRELDYYRRAIAWYCRQNVRTWELGNWGHFDLFESREGLNLIAGPRLNLRNVAALAEAAQLGCRMAVLSFEITRQELELLGGKSLHCIPVVAVHSWPPVFTSRLLPALLEGKLFFTPRKEAYLLKKEGKTALIYPDRPVNWFEHLPALRSMGYRHFLIDASSPERRAGKLVALLRAFERAKPPVDPHSEFNFSRRP